MFNTSALTHMNQKFLAKLFLPKTPVATNALVIVTVR